MSTCADDISALCAELRRSGELGVRAIAALDEFERAAADFSAALAQAELPPLILPVNQHNGD